MKMTSIIPMLPVKSMPVSVAWYEKLGFSVVDRKDEWRWAMLEFGDCHLMVDQSINVDPKATRMSVLYLYSDDIVDYHAMLRGNGVKVPDLETSFYGMLEFRMNDPDGNRLWIGQAKTTLPGAA